MNPPDTHCLACRRQRYFTLVELLVVLAIIMLLAGLLVGGAGMVGRKSADAKTRAQINILEVALEQYRQEFGYFPISPAAIRLSRVFLEGENYPSSSPTERHHGLEKPSGILQAGKYFVAPGTLTYLAISGTDYAVDGYRQPYRYQCPGTHNPQTYDLWSYGADKTNNTGDDLNNWEKN
jgi:general secretion pathway protein G